MRLCWTRQSFCIPSSSFLQKPYRASNSNPGVRLGGAEVVDPDALMGNAVELAKEADVVIAVVGLSAEWETESHDRTTLALRGRTDELVAKVAAANPRTIVVVQAVCFLPLETCSRD